MSKPTEISGFVTPPDPPFDIEGTAPQCDSPLRHKLQVRWGDCDPAQIAYTANIPAWGLEAIEHWYRQCLGIGWYEINLDHGIGTPFVSIQFDFHAPVNPRSELEIDVYVTRLGRTSLSHYVEAFQQQIKCWSGTTTAVFVEAANMKPMAIQPNMCAVISNYVDRQGRQFPLPK